MRADLPIAQHDLLDGARDRDDERFNAIIRPEGVGDNFYKRQVLDQAVRAVAEGIETAGMLRVVRFSRIPRRSGVSRRIEESELVDGIVVGVR